MCNAKPRDSIESDFKPFHGFPGNIFATMRERHGGQSSLIFAPHLLPCFPYKYAAEDRTEGWFSLLECKLCRAYHTGLQHVILRTPNLHLCCNVYITSLDPADCTALRSRAVLGGNK
jgi:hypothetical protein